VNQKVDFGDSAKTWQEIRDMYMALEKELNEYFFSRRGKGGQELVSQAQDRLSESLEIFEQIKDGKDENHANSIVLGNSCCSG